MRRPLWLSLGVFLAAAELGGQTYDRTDLRDRDRLVILLFGDSGTGDAGQHRVGSAMYEICRERDCQFALMLGDNVYENGIQVTARNSVEDSYQEILDQFNEKFEAPYRRFEEIEGFRFWAVLGNHDYRKNTLGTWVTYTEFSKLWRLPALHYDVPDLPEWIQIYGLHTDSDVRRDLNGLQVHAAKRALCGERDDKSTNRWRVVFGHQPVYNNGHHQDNANERRVRALLEKPLFRECGVHLYVAGHAHHQEHITAEGFEQVIQGASAKSKGRNKGPKLTRTTQRHFSREFGFAILEVDPVRLRLDFYDVLGTREKGDVVAPGPEDIFRSYSWCGARGDVGKPGSPARPCR